MLTGTEKRTVGRNIEITYRAGHSKDQIQLHTFKSAQDTTSSFSHPTVISYLHAMVSQKLQRLPQPDYIFTCLLHSRVF